MPDSRALKGLMMMGKKAMNDVMDTGRKIAKEYRKGKQHEKDMSGKMPKRMPKQ